MGHAFVRYSATPRERAAVSTLFFVNGYVVGSWAPRIPSFKTSLGVDEAALGLLVLAVGVGSIVAMPLAAAAMAREGSHRLACAAALGLAPMLLVVTAAPGPWSAAVLLAVFGALVGSMDVATNANAVLVERGAGRAILSSCHGWWSLGGLFGAATGGVLIARLGSVGHAAVVGAVASVLLAAALPAVLHDRPEARPAQAGAPLPSSHDRVLPFLVGVVALLAVIPEGVVLDWGALYLRQEHGTALEAAGLAFAAFSAATAAMRFGGDVLRDRLGAVWTVRLSALSAAVGFLVVGSAESVATAVAGFALAGCGVANLVPIAFAAAGNLPGVAPGTALSIASFFGYGGFLVAPPLVGLVAQRTGLAPVYAAVPLLLVAVVALSGLLRHADRRDG